MPKSRKTKAKHQDFQKVKLKVGKKLPHAANETVASFKSQSIQLKDQYKETSSSEPKTKRKQGLHDLLSHCQHYNVGVKLDALSGLKELLASNPDLLHSSLATVLDRLSSLLVDKDASVREAVLKLLKQVLPRVPTNQIAPFFPLLSTHLCCAMTHIQDDIQVDSLAVVDLLLDRYPTLVVSGSVQLLPNFIEQISRQTQGGGSKGSEASGNKRTLLVNPGSRLTSPAWRVKILERIHKFLKAVVSMKDRKGRREEAGLRSTAEQSVRHTVKWTDGPGISVQPLGSSAVQNITSPGYLLRPKGALTISQEQDILASPAKFQWFVQTVVPLLLQCWVEVGPAQLTSSLPDNTLSTISLATLASVLNVLQLLLQYTQRHLVDNNVINMAWVRQRYSKDCIQHFVTNFPYTMNEARLQQKGKKDPNMPQVSMQTLNLLVCEVMCHFVDPSDDAETVPLWFGRLADYAGQQLGANVSGGFAQLTQQQLTSLLGIVQHMLSLPLDRDVLLRLQDSLCHLDGLYQQRGHVAHQLQILDFLTKLVFDANAPTALKVRSACLDQWVASLCPRLMGQTSSVQHRPLLNQLLCTARLAAQQRCPAFLHSLQTHLPQLIDQLPQLSADNQRHLVEILSNVDRLDHGGLSRLVEACHSENVSPAVLRYLLQVVQYRFEKLTMQGMGDFVEPAHYLSFLFSVLIGISREALSALQGDGGPSSSQRVFRPRCTWLDGQRQNFEQHKLKLQCCLETLKQLPESGVVWLAWQRLATDLMRKSLLPMTSAFAIVSASAYLHSVLPRRVSTPDSFLEDLSKLIGSVLHQCHKSSGNKADINTEPSQSGKETASLADNPPPPPRDDQAGNQGTPAEGEETKDGHELKETSLAATAMDVEDTPTLAQPSKDTETAWELTFLQGCSDCVTEMPLVFQRLLTLAKKIMQGRGCVPAAEFILTMMLNFLKCPQLSAKVKDTLPGLLQLQHIVEKQLPNSESCASFTAFKYQLSLLK